ncbi:MAG TPA: TlpA disulfide reductase family protein [Planctomycetota bacterium]
MRAFRFVIAILIFSVGCGSGPQGAGSNSRNRWPGDVKNIVAAHKGQVLLLLMGRDDCPGTARATEILDKYKRPEGVAAVRVEVPLPEEDLKPPERWAHTFPYAIDTGRQLASTLEFFYYPTLYIYDRDGQLRFTGDCDVSGMPKMVGKIVAEAPGSPKKSYTLPQPEPGTIAPAFAGKKLDDSAVKLDELRGKRATLLMFSATSCPFSVGALKPLAAVTKAFKEHGVSAVVINREQTKDEISDVYQENVPGLPVVWDQSGEICKSYGVSAVPFFYLLDADSKIVARRSFTPEAATGALNKHLGLAVPTPRYKSKGAG